MMLNIFMSIIGLILLTAGAEGLVRGSASLALRVRIAPLIIGLTIVAFGTSAPELVVSLVASLKNQGDIAVGNVVGSNIFNIGIILGFTALICPVKASLQIIKQDGPIMIAVSILTIIIITKGIISRLMGIILLTTLVAYTGYTVLMAKRGAPSEIERQFHEGVPARTKSLLQDLMFIGGGLLFLVVGSRLLVESASAIARLVGISEAVIGLTIIAAGTSMPELTTSIVAAIRSQPDIAVGNVVGSNIFNILGILGVASIVKPLTASGITDFDLWVMVAFAIALLPLLYTKLKLQRWEGVLLLSGYIAYLWVLWPSA
jgi:cation:H+ antiporter